MSGAATPHASTSARASLAPTGTATPAPASLPAVPALPPSTFDFLPDLHRILNRLLSTSAQPPGAAPTPGQPAVDGPLDIQQISTAATEVKLKLQKARKAVMALPDVGDLVAVLDVGAYGATESMPLFLSHPLPPEVAIRGGEAWVARPRLDPDAWLAAQVGEPPRG